MSAFGTFRVGIVGAGPAGLATATHLVEHAERQISVDLIDSRLVPFGLLGHGVAPDLESGRATLNEYARLFDRENVRFIGGVQVGRDLLRSELLDAYDAVVYATGASVDNLIDVPGEKIPGVVSGRRFSDWYTGAPDAAPIDLAGVTNAVIVGLGDVAVDFARMLLTSPDELSDSEMPSDVLMQLRAHRVRDVTILVRRGPADCELKPRDLEALLSIPGLAVRFDPKALNVDLSNVTPKVRSDWPLWEAAAKQTQSLGCKKRLKIRFFTRATEIRGIGKAEGVKIERTQVDRNGRLVSAGGEDMIPAQLVLRATGYRGVEIPGVPFDNRTGTIPTKDQRVVDLSGTVQAREYAAGWIANGWQGGFGTQRRNGAAVADRILSDFERHSTTIEQLLADRSVEPVGIDAWRRVREAEADEGRLRDRACVKLSSSQVNDIARGLK